MTWIKLSIHRKHEKILRISDATGTSPKDALAAVIDWFRWVDEHAEDADVSASFLGFREVASWPDDALAQAMLHKKVDWLVKGSDGRLRPTRIDTYFGAGTKRRAVHAKQVAHKRAQGCAQTDVQTRPDQSETDTSGSNQTSGVVPVASGLAGWPEWTHLGRKAIQAENVAGVLRDLGLREPLLGQTAGLVDISVREIVAMAQAVGSDTSVYKPSSRPAIVSDRLFRARQLERPREHRGGKATKAAAHLGGEDLSGLEQVIKRRGFK